MSSIAKPKELKNIDNYEELDRFFEVSSIKDPEFLLREVRRKIIEKYEGVIDIFNSFLHPDTNIIQVNDTYTLSSEDKDEIIKILRQFTVIIKNHQLLEIESNDDEELKFCSTALETYKANVKIIKRIISKVQQSYMNNIKVKDEVHYLG